MEQFRRAFPYGTFTQPRIRLQFSVFFRVEIGYTASVFNCRFYSVSGAGPKASSPIVNITNDRLGGAELSTSIHKPKGYGL